MTHIGPLSKPDRIVKSWSENDNDPVVAEKNDRRRYDVKTLMDIRRKMGSSTESSVPIVEGKSGKAIDTTSKDASLIVFQDLMKVDDDGILRANQGNSRANTERSSGVGHDVPDRSSKQPPTKNTAIEKRDFHDDRDGFAKFLQEHTSPRHQRVTAGGRIVPFNPDSRPAPEFKLPTRGDEAKTSVDHAKFQQRPKREKPTIGATVMKNQQEERIFDQKQSSNAAKKTLSPLPLSPPPTALLGNSPPLLQQMLPSLSNNEEGLSTEEYPSGDGTDTHNRDATWFNPMYSPMMPQALGPAYPSAFPLGMSPNNFNANPAMYPMSPTAIGSSNAFCGGFGFESETPIHSWEEAQAEFLKLSQQISDLDRYMALNTFHIDVAAKKGLVEQRVELVKSLDATRAAKEYFESTAQASAQHAPEGYGFPQSEEEGNHQRNPQFHDPNAQFSPNPWGVNYLPAYPGCFPGVNFGAEGTVPMGIPWQPAYPGNWPMGKRATEIYSTHASNDDSQCNNENDTQFGAYASKQVVAPDFEIPKRDRAPVELMRVYHNIENAVKNGGDVAPHLEELSSAISGLKLRHSRTRLRNEDKPVKDMSKQDTNSTRAEKEPVVLPEADVLCEISRNSEPSGDGNKKKRLVCHSSCVPDHMRC